MKILHIVRELDIGGIQIMLNNLLETAPFKKESHCVLCIGEPNTPVQLLLEDKGIEVFCIPKRIIRDRGYRPYHLWKIIRKIMRSVTPKYGYYEIYKLISRKKIDLVHTHYQTGLYGQVIAAGLARSKVVWSIHGFYKLQRSDQFIGNLAFRLLGCQNIIFTGVSKAALEFTLTKNKFDKLPVKRYVIYNGIDLEYFYQSVNERNKIRAQIPNIKADSILIGSMGRLVADKGYEVLIDSVFKNKESLGNVKFIIGGDGCLRDALQKKVIAKNLEKLIQFLGFVNNVAEYMYAFDIYVQPSIKEGLGVTIIEALAAGLPVIASDTGGIPEVIENGKSGILVRPNDSDDLGRALVSLINDKNKRKELSKHSTEIAERFQIESTAHAYLQVYDELIK
ncbi:MAG: glycosyltransferase [Anaerolineales bacterium]